MRIGILGALQVNDDAGQPVRVGGQRVRALLILLALDPGRVVPAGSLTDRLWGEDPPADAGNALQTVVSRLRAALRAGFGAGVIESHPAGYRLAVEKDAVDAFEFERLARDGKELLARGDTAEAAVVLREALSRWRGSALADVADAPFAAGPAARLEELRAAALHDRVAADLALGEAAGVIAELRSVVASDPLDERSRALLMRALCASGRQADALAVYTEARGLLARELGVGPSPVLEQAYLAVLRNDGQGEPERNMAPAQGTLRLPARPKPLNLLVGRDDDIRGLLKKLTEDRLVTLTGPGGVGKTRLASEVALRLDASTRNGPHAGAWLAELAPVTDPAEVPYAVLDALGIRERVMAGMVPDPAAGPHERLTESVGDRHVVLILDNCEHVIEAAAALAERLLGCCQNARIVATSREPLRITGETLWPVRPLAVPPGEAAAAGPSEIGGYPAVRLLADRAAAVAPGFEVCAANAAATARICQALDGMPLAIELAAAWLRTLSPGQLAERLDDRFALLTGGSRTALPRHQTLRAVVAWSWDLLTEREQILARRLSVFPGGVTLEAAEEVCAGGPLPRAEVLAALSGLVDKSIVSASGGTDGARVRYRMPETVRAYCLERLAEAGEEAGARAGFSTFFLRLAEAADSGLRTREQRAWLGRLTAEQDNLNAALRQAIGGGDVQTALLFVRALGWYWMLAGRGDAEPVAREVVALWRAAGSSGGAPSLKLAEARVTAALTACGNGGDFEAVLDVMSGALAEMDALRPDWRRHHLVAVLCEALVAMSDRQVSRTLGLFSGLMESDDPWQRAAGRLFRGSFAVMLGRGEGAAEDFGTALAQFRPLGEGWGTAACLLYLGELARQRGDFDAALADLEEARRLILACAWGDISHIDGKLAALRIRTGDFAGAREYLVRAERLAARLGAGVFNYADVWLSMVRSDLDWREGNLAAAIGASRRVLRRLESRDSVWWCSFRSLAEGRLGLLETEAGNEDAGRALVARAVASAAAGLDRPSLAAAIDSAAALACSRGDQGSAAALLGAAHTIRGRFDESSLDSPSAREAARLALGEQGYEVAYRRGRGLTDRQAVELATSVTGEPGQKE